MEFLLGLFAEDHSEGAIFGSLLNAMVASDTFTHALTNPLLSKNIFNVNTFTDYGLDLIKKTSLIKDIVDVNVKSKVDIRVSFDVTV